MSLSKIQTELKKRISPIEKLPAGGYQASIVFDRDFCGFDGHFEGNPIVPAICLISVLELMAQSVIDVPVKLQEIVSMKFKAPFRPNEKAVYNFSVSGNGTFSVNATIKDADGSIASKIKILCNSSGPQIIKCSLAT